MADSSKKDEVAVEIKKVPPPPRRSVLQRVPALLRGNQKHTYDPVVVPLGPYHHGRLPEYQLAEQVKEELLDMVCGDGDRGVPLGLVLERVAEIRQFYGGADGYGDKKLAAMMLRDTCFVLCCINFKSKHEAVIVERLGLSGFAFTIRDLSMLENQIPLWLINLLAPFFASDDEDEDEDEDEDDGELRLRSEGAHQIVRSRILFLLSLILNPDSIGMKTTKKTKTKLPWGTKQGGEPLHLLEASHRVLLRLDQDDNQPPKIRGQLFDSPFRSLTDLKAKGVHFGPSSHSLKDISFFSYSTHGRLHLPKFRITHNSWCFISNLVAYEMTSDGSIDMGVIRYVNFMKTLVRSAEDVKLLREKGVLQSTLANDDEVIRLFQDTGTYGFSVQFDLNDVKMKIEDHCNNKGKTWLAELVNTYFRSPLTAIALFAAAFILTLTCLQTFYTINPKYANAAP